MCKNILDKTFSSCNSSYVYTFGNYSINIFSAVFANVYFIFSEQEVSRKLLFFLTRMTSQSNNLRFRNSSRIRENSRMLLFILSLPLFTSVELWVTISTYTLMYRTQFKSNWRSRIIYFLVQLHIFLGEWCGIKSRCASTNCQRKGYEWHNWL